MKTTLKTLTLTAVSLAASMTIVGCGGGDSEKDAHNDYMPVTYPYPAQPLDEATKAKYIALVNQIRSQGRMCGSNYRPPVPPLKWSEAAYRAAKEHSDDMFKTGFASHSGSGTDNDWTHVVQNFDVPSGDVDRLNNNFEVRTTNLRNVGENVAWGYATVEQALNGWLSSPGHCDLLMDDGVTYFGLAGSGDKWTMVAYSLYE